MQYFENCFKQMLIVSAIGSLLGSVAHAQSCAAVYENSISNVEIAISEKTEKSYFFHLHCAKSGNTRAVETGASLSFPLEGVPTSISGSGNFSQKQLQEFCKVGAERNYFNNSEFGFGRYTSESAFRSFNDCIALEKSRVQVTHQVASPESFIVFIEFKGVTSLGTLDQVEYDPRKMTCRTAGFSADGSEEVIHGSMRKTIGTKNISVGCVREPVAHSGGEYFPQAEFQVSTSWGPYSVSLPGDELYGYELASQARAAHAETVDVLNRNVKSRLGWKKRARKVERQMRDLKHLTVYQGNQQQGSGVIETACGAPVNAEFANKECLSRNAKRKKLRMIATFEGGQCGHTFWALVCVPK